jgi:hypothetical protein
MSGDPFLNLQDGFYNTLSQGLGFPPGSPFQLLQPSTPLVSSTSVDQMLWAYFDNIPPYSLTQNYIASGGNRFFSDYKGLLSALVGAPNTFVQDIGNDVYAQWLAYLSHRAKLPAVTQLPQLFLNWAMVYHPAVATIGASDLSQILLDPITSAQTEIVQVYSGKLPNWSLNYKDLLKQLMSAPQITFSASSSSWNSDVSKSWTGGSNEGFFGLWGGSSSSSESSRTFASSEVSVNASFAHVTTFQAAPGAWYSSAAMGDAYAHTTGAPWKPGVPIDWDTTFDARDGNMARFAASLIVVEQMNVSVRAAASFSSEQQTEIRNNQHAGMWPFYSSGSGSGSSTVVDFDSDGSMTVQITSEPKIPIVLGVNVLPVDRYVGHAVAAATRMRELAPELELAAH